MYSDAQQTRQLESLKHFLVNNPPLILVINDENTAKTALISKLIADIQTKKRVIRLQSDENLLPAQLTQLLLQHCEVELDDVAISCEQQLDKIIQSLATQNLACVFIIDDAERLPATTLAALLHMSMKQNTYHTHLHILLVGNSKLTEKIQPLHPKPIPQLLIKTYPQKETRPKEKHWVKAISLSLLLIIGFVMWYHKEHSRLPFMHSRAQALEPVTMTGDVRFVSTDKESKPITTAATKPISPVTPQPSPKIQIKTKQVALKPPQKPAYILQLMGSRNLNALEHFVAKNNLTKKTHIMATVYEGKPWYIISYGEYQTTFQAKTARQQLPTTLQKLHPWVRPTSTIH